MFDSHHKGRYSKIARLQARSRTNLQTYSRSDPKPSRVTQRVSIKSLFRSREGNRLDGSDRRWLGLELFGRDFDVQPVALTQKSNVDGAQDLGYGLIWFNSEARACGKPNGGRERMMTTRCLRPARWRSVGRYRRKPQFLWVTWT